MSERSCNICLQALGSGQGDYHTTCCQQLFDSASPPKLPYTWDQVEYGGYVSAHGSANGTKIPWVDGAGGTCNSSLLFQPTV